MLHQAESVYQVVGECVAWAVYIYVIALVARTLDHVRAHAPKDKHNDPYGHASGQ